MASFILYIYLLFIHIVAAKDITQFCKCTCGQNSTILEMTPYALSHLPHPSKPVDIDTLLMDKICMNCTRALCGIAEPDLCEGAATDEEIAPLCFQRDSLQDEVIVSGFLLLVIGLLVWTAIRSRIEPVFQALWNRRNQYANVANE